MDQLPIEAREICERLEAEGGALPRPRGGRPKDEDFPLRVFMLVLEAIDTHGRERGGTDRAIRQVADDVGRSYEQVRAIYYERKDDPHWQAAAAISRGL